VRVFKNPWFQGFARKEAISDAGPCDAVARVSRGLIDADLGGGLIKQRVARPGAGRSAGYRTLVLFRAGSRAVFAFGFAKSGMDNLGETDEADLKSAAKVILALSEADVDRLVANATLMEVECD
jgi:hypothetical protein